jgi:glycosyltransferase involved in cell wall biosynthesis
MRVVHVISNLGIGGAELSLCSLVERLSCKGVDHVVVSLLPGGVLRPRLEEAGARVIELDGRRGLGGVLLLRELGSRIGAAKPDLIHAWMYHSNIAATVAQGLGYLRCPVIWSIRQGLENRALDGYLTRALIRLGATLSNYPDVVVYNSEDAALTHEAIGYAASRRWVIRNGIDCHRFRPRPEARAALRMQLQLEDEVALIGRIARYSPMKDFETLIGAFRELLKQLPHARLLLVGTDLDPGNKELVALCQRHGCLDQILFVGPRLDIEQIYPALDVLVSSSSANEGFPNVVAEALASGTLVASTSVGESFLINEGSHRVVSPKNEPGLCDAILSLVRLPSEEKEMLSARGRGFIEVNFSIDAFAAAHADLYRRLVHSH